MDATICPDIALLLLTEHSAGFMVRGAKAQNGIVNVNGYSPRECGSTDAEKLYRNVFGISPKRRRNSRP